MSEKFRARIEKFFPLDSGRWGECKGHSKAGDDGKQPPFSPSKNFTASLLKPSEASFEAETSSEMCQFLTPESVKERRSFVYPRVHRWINLSTSYHATSMPKFVNFVKIVLDFCFVLWYSGSVKIQLGTEFL